MGLVVRFSRSGSIFDVGIAMVLYVVNLTKDLHPRRFLFMKPTVSAYLRSCVMIRPTQSVVNSDY